MPSSSCRTITSWCISLSRNSPVWYMSGVMIYDSVYFLRFSCTQPFAFFSKSKGQVISHVTCHVPSPQSLSHGTSHVMGQVINHVMADSCITCTWLVTQQLTERQALMTHRWGCHAYLWIRLLIGWLMTYKSDHVTLVSLMYKSLRSLPWVPISTSCGFGTQVSIGLWCINYAI
jgi:hypothetical protein